jgi:hypothetical protein
MSEIDFIYKINPNKKERIIKSEYLKSDFRDTFWIIGYGENKKLKIDFNVKLGDNSSLIDVKNENLLITLKYWLLEAITPEKGIAYSDKIIPSYVRYVLSIFDYLNINDQHSKISKFGFSGLSIEFLKNMFNEIASNSNKNNTIYKIKSVFSNYYFDSVENISSMKKYKIKEDVFLLNDEQMEDLKIHIKNNKKFKIKNLYPNALSKPQGFPEELKDLSQQKDIQEYPSYYRERELRPLSKDGYSMYLKLFNKIGKIKNIDDNVSIPESHIFDEIRKYKPTLEESGRVQTVSARYIFDTFKTATEFHYKYGNDIVETYTNFVNTLNKDRDSTQKFNFDKIAKKALEDSLVGELKKMQIERWNIINVDIKDRYEYLRENKTLRDLIQVYYGSAQLIIGALMARRQSELGSLESQECLDDENKLLFFKRSKSTKGLFGTKDTLALPIDELGMEIINNIQKIHQITNKNTPLFAMPDFYNPTKVYKNLKSEVYNLNLDRFIDYIETPLVNEKRMYIRQHQLRRFFAMSFFWGSGFGGMDTLRWFMGHTDSQHLYHYISESTSGEVLRSTKAQYAAEHIDNYEELESFIKERYNTENINLIEEEELAYYIEDLLEAGEVKVEPYFFENDNGQQYEIIVKIKEKED